MNPNGRLKNERRKEGFFAWRIVSEICITNDSARSTQNVDQPQDLDDGAVALILGLQGLAVCHPLGAVTWRGLGPETSTCITAV